MKSHRAHEYGAVYNLHSYILTERDVLEALGEYKCDAGMSVENVSAVG
jgi:hypothetical protein